MDRDKRSSYKQNKQLLTKSMRECLKCAPGYHLFFPICQATFLQQNWLLTQEGQPPQWLKASLPELITLFHQYHYCHDMTSLLQACFPEPSEYEITIGYISHRWNFEVCLYIDQKTDLECVKNQLVSFLKACAYAPFGLTIIHPENMQPNLAEWEDLPFCKQNDQFKIRCLSSDYTQLIEKHSTLMPSTLKKILFGAPFTEVGFIDSKIMLYPSLEWMHGHLLMLQKNLDLEKTLIEEAKHDHGVTPYSSCFIT